MYAFLAAFTLTVFPVAAVADEPTPQQVLESMTQTADLVRSYDIDLKGTLKRTLNLKTQKANGKTIGGWKRLEPGEIPWSRAFHTRQVMADQAKQRVEIFDPVSGECSEIVVSNGKTQTTWRPKAKSAWIGPPQIVRVSDGHHYGELYRNAFDNTTFATLFLERKNLKQDQDVRALPNYVIETVPGDGTPFQGNGWRLWLNPNNGYLPVRSDKFLQTMDRIVTSMDVTEFKRIAGGVEVPIKATIKQFDASRFSETLGEVAEVYEYEVDVAKSRWNFEPDADTFEVRLPNGTRVEDSINRKIYVVRDAE